MKRGASPGNAKVLNVVQSNGQGMREAGTQCTRSERSSNENSILSSNEARLWFGS
jgi:hypothetical protein